MKTKTALITGITGQDGSYLADFLLSKGYQVYGLYRRTSRVNIENITHLFQGSNISRIEGTVRFGRFCLVEGDITDYVSLRDLIINIAPDEIYNLAAQSHVGHSFVSPLVTTEVNALGAINVFEAALACARATDHWPKVYQASTSEMFGNASSPQNEDTPFMPRSPYAAAKVYAHHMASIYREEYGLFVACGILFNHESPRRGENFLTRKVTKTAAEIKHAIESGQKPPILKLGNLYAYRDWGYAPEYVDAMHRMLQQDDPSDFVIATGQTCLVKDFVEEVFRIANLDMDTYVSFDKELERPLEVDKLQGDPSKAKVELGWQPRVFWKELAQIMYDHDYKMIRELV